MSYFINTNIREIKEERKKTLDKYNAQFINIKEVCCKFFQKYDIDLDE